jgi:hypothetical protein
MRLQYDEARKRIQTIQQQLADLEEKVTPGQAESDKDRLVKTYWDAVCAMSEIYGRHRTGTRAGPWEHCTEPADFVKWWEFPEEVRNSLASQKTLPNGVSMVSVDTVVPLLQPQAVLKSFREMCQI